MFDVAKAFDSINHNILFSKLLYYGLSPRVVMWFKSYLSDRVGCINTLDQATQYKLFDIGVPQGSVLGPLLFNIYVNDLAMAVDRATVIQFADDTTLLVKSRQNADHFVSKLEGEVCNLLTWFTVNRLMINVRKTDFMVLGRHRNCVTSINVGGDQVSCSHVVKYLGLRVDDNLSWSTHINYVISRMRLLMLAFNRLRFAFSREIRLHLTKTLIMPVIDLYDFIYGVADNSNLHHLEVAFNDLMRSIVGVRRSARMRISDLLHLTGFDDLRVRRERSLRKFITNVITEVQYSNIRSECISNKNRHDYFFRNDCYIVPKYVTKFGRRRICVRGLQLLNSAKM
jgi:hypothetical protein